MNHAKLSRLRADIEGQIQRLHAEADKRKAEITDQADALTGKITDLQQESKLIGSTIYFEQLRKA